MAKKEKRPVKEFHAYVDDFLYEKLKNNCGKKQYNLYFMEQFFELYLDQKEEVKEEIKQRVEDLCLIQKEYEEINEILKRLSKEDYLRSIQEYLTYATQLFDQYQEKYPLENYARNTSPGKINIKIRIDPYDFHRIEEICIKEKITLSQFIISCINKKKTSYKMLSFFEEMFTQILIQLQFFLRRINLFDQEEETLREYMKLKNKLQLEVQRYKKYVL